MEIPTEPMREKSREWFLNYCRLINEQISFNDDILKNDEYMQKLMAVLNRKKQISFINMPDGDVKYPLTPDEKRLMTLYSLVRKYANNNYVVSIVDEDGNSYYIRYKKMVIKVGFSMDKDPTYFAKKIDEVPEGVIILPFENMQEGLLLSENREVKKELVELYNFIRSLKASGIIDDDIIYTTAQALKYVK